MACGQVVGDSPGIIDEIDDGVSMALVPPHGQP